MRECWNWQTGTFEVRVSTTYGFKSRLAHQRQVAAPKSRISLCGVRDFYCPRFRLASNSSPQPRPHSCAVFFVAQCAISSFSLIANSMFNGGRDFCYPYILKEKKPSFGTSPKETCSLPIPKTPVPLLELSPRPLKSRLTIPSLPCYPISSTNTKRSLLP